MSMLSSAASFHTLTRPSSSSLSSSSSSSSSWSGSIRIPHVSCFVSALAKCTTTTTTRSRRNALNNDNNPGIVQEETEMAGQSVLYSVSPLPLLLLAALPGAGSVRLLFEPIVEVVRSFNLPGWLVHWGHPGNMAVVLFAMGGYGTYLGFRIRFSDDVEEKAMAKDLHPKLLAGMFFFFALGATGGIISLLTSDKPILESPHAVTGLIGLTLLALQTSLPILFEGNPGLRTVHGILGSGIMTLFLVHAALGLQLGFSY